MMKSAKQEIRIVTISFFLLLASASIMCVPGYGQSKPEAGQGSGDGAVPAEYEVGPGDILAVTIAEAPEFNGKFRVNERGELPLPELATPVPASGQTPFHLAQTVKQALIGAKLFRNPTVNVFVDEYHSRNITVLGAVSKPSVYALQKRTTVLEAISLAGGLLPTAGNTVTLTQGGIGEGSASRRTTRTIELSSLVRADNAELNSEVHDGDVISVSNAEVVYVVGAVVKPGGFAFPDQSAGMTVLRALSLAEGTNSVAAKSRAVIIHRSGVEGEREDIPVDINKILNGKSEDLRMKPNDILFIPVSGAKQTLHVAGDVAMAAVNGIAIYGIGYRIGNVR